MRVYVDSSALLKRVVLERRATELSAALVRHSHQGDAIVCSSLGWIEVTRALRARPGSGDDEVTLNARCDAALSGVAERPITADVVALARRLIDAARLQGLRTSSPAA